MNNPPYGSPVPPKGSTRFEDGALVTELVGPEPSLTETDDYRVRRDNWAAVTQSQALQVYGGTVNRPLDFEDLVRMGERYLRTGEIR